MTKLPSLFPAGEGDNELAYCRKFGFDARKYEAFDISIGCCLPEGVIVFSGLARDVTPLVKTLPVPPKLVGVHQNAALYIYREAPDYQPPMAEGVRVLRAGDDVRLPIGRDFNTDTYYAQHIDELTLLEPDDDASENITPDPVAPVAPDTAAAKEEEAPPVIADCPLVPFSLRGQAEEFARNATQAKPLLGKLCLSGQSTVWFAGPGTGKTLLGLKLLADAISEGRIDAGNVFYINADDNSEGFADKMRMMDDLGAHTLCPGYGGFKADKLGHILDEMAQKKKARGVLIIIDTAKKFTSLMDKNRVSAFTQSCRMVVMEGGTILMFAHTAKNPNADGTLRYSGTTDMVDDADAMYIMTPQSIDGECIVRFDNKKRRSGKSPMVAAYRYMSDGDLTYAERLATVEEADPDELERFQRITDEKSDAEIIAAIETSIRAGTVQKMELVKAVKRAVGVSNRTALRVLDKYTGTDPERHRWTYSVHARGAKHYSLLT